MNHGTAILQSEDQCNAYLAAYGLMHTRKMLRALDDNEFPFEDLKLGVELYDWGCGQGLGALAVIEKLREKSLLFCLRKVTLEEPSDMTRSRALLHVQRALKNANVEIVTTSQFLPSDTGDNSNSISSIEVTQPCALHIFSNILDIEQVSLAGVSKMITSSGRQHIVLCVGPKNSNTNRLNTFVSYFKQESVTLITEVENVAFGKHPNGRNYGCFIKSFSFSLSNGDSALQQYKYFAPLQFFASYTYAVEKTDLNNAAFEILAPFDMTAHKELLPPHALISNLISRGCPTYASQTVIDAIGRHIDKVREYKTVARIQKTFIEAIISGRLDLFSNGWKILIIEDNTSVARLAVKDFYDMYHHIIDMTEYYDDIHLPDYQLYNRNDADAKTEYDLIIDISVDKICDAQSVVFSKYKVKNGCFFIVRSSKEVFAKRYLYTTERIKYKGFAVKNSRGIYDVDVELVDHLRYFLRLLFRKEDFRPGQLPILNRALQLKSVIGLLPTGGGKSLTYQLAALLQPAVTLVVDPIKGLMKNQFDGLKQIGIDAISFINSDITQSNPIEAKRRQTMLTTSQLQMMFLSPERLSIYTFRDVLRSMRESDVYFAYGVIDEVHCVSEWGHDFRLAYLHLGRNLHNYVLPKKVEGQDEHISLFGLTATASFDVLADVERELSGIDSYSLDEDATIRYENTNRLELQYNIFTVDTEEKVSESQIGILKQNRLLEAIKDATYKVSEIQEKKSVDNIKRLFCERENIVDDNQEKKIYAKNLDVHVENNWWQHQDTQTSTIVFCPFKNNRSLSVDWVANILCQNGFKYFSTYYGGVKSESQDTFLKGETNTMVATKAFGMGIDKSNVRMTFHMNYPGSLESFVQEAGRAGRDQKMALATILYCPKKFPAKNIRTQKWEQHTSDYNINKFFYDGNFLGVDFEIHVMTLLMNNVPVTITNEEFRNVECVRQGQSCGILRFLTRYDKGSVLTYYLKAAETESVLENYNKKFIDDRLPIFNTENAKRNGANYIKDHGSSEYQDAIQKAIYRMCVIGLIDDFTTCYYQVDREWKTDFRITTICQEESAYFSNLKFYYRKYYSEERAEAMMDEVRELALTEGAIMACLKHLTTFVYRSIADKRARGILDVEQFCNMATSTNRDWKAINEDLKDFIYYYFNSKYAREGFSTYDSNKKEEIPFSLKDDVNHDYHSENEITSFDLVEKYMRVVDSEIVNNDSQTDNVKHLHGAIRLIRRAVVEMNPVLNLLNIFCILFLKQQNNEMLENELYEDYKAVMYLYIKEGKRQLLNRYTELLVQHSAITDDEKIYIEKIQCAIQLEEHVVEFTTISTKYTMQ